MHPRNATLLLLVFVLQTASTIAKTWHITSLGRITSLTPLTSTSTSDAILTSARSTIARLTPTSPDPIWRFTPLASETLLHLRVESLPDESASPLIVTLWSPCLLRALSAATGAVLYELPATEYVRASNEPFLHVTFCPQISSPSVWIDLQSGRPSPVDIDPSLQTNHTEPASPPLSDIPQNNTLSWALSNLTVTSFSDGLLTATDSTGILWQREHGLAHGTAAAFFTPVAAETSTLTVLTDLHVVFGLATHDGKVLWKTALPEHTHGKCALVHGHVRTAVVVCSDTTRSTVVMVDTASGDISAKRVIEGFTAVQATLDDDCCGENAVCVKLLAADATEQHIRPPGCAARATGGFWLSHSPGGTHLRGVRAGNTIWHVNLPEGATLSTVLSPRRPLASAVQLRPPAVRVTSDRQLLFKHVDADITLALANDVEKNLIYAMLVDSRSGSLYDMVTHPEAAEPISAVRGENWFVYSFWNRIMLEQEVHFLDLYRPARNTSWVLDRFRDITVGTLGPKVAELLNVVGDQHHDQCSVSAEVEEHTQQCVSKALEQDVGYPKSPVVLRSSSLLTKRVVAMHSTETEMGITEPAVMMTLETGQVALVSKLLLDARRPKNPTMANRQEFLIPYRPLISLGSTSREAFYITKDQAIPCVKSIAVAPVHRRESATQIAIIGTDVFARVVKPGGSFDSLPSDFWYSAVVITIVLLASAFFYTKKMKIEQALSRSW